jgi:hypothetical protein
LKRPLAFNQLKKVNMLIKSYGKLIYVFEKKKLIYGDIDSL